MVSPQETEEKLTHRLRRWIPEWPPFKPDLARETAWLDGVRGLAAFLVMANHFNIEWMSPSARAPFGAEFLVDYNGLSIWYYAKGTRLWQFWRLPFLRLFIASGEAQVAVFFVLSGFVLSWGPLKKIRAGKYDQVAQNLGSSVIRRWFRLFLPCVIVSSIYMIGKLVRGEPGVWGILKELWAFIVENERWTRPFTTGWTIAVTANNAYNFVMWTIPFEFGGSVFIYVTVLTLGRITSYPRRAFVILMVSLHACTVAQWPMWLFGSGLLLADYVQQAGGFDKLTQRTSRLGTVFWSMALVVGLYLLGYESPSDVYTRPGYSWMDTYLSIPSGYLDWVAPGRFWWGWGGILMITSSCHLRLLRRLFETWVIQYLGRISFMLYLIHMFVARNVGTPLRKYLYDKYSTHDDTPPFGFIYTATPLLIFTIFATLWLVCATIAMTLSHFLEIYVDRPCTRTGHIVDDILLTGFPNIRWRTPKEVESSRSMEQVHLLESVDVELGDMPDDDPSARPVHSR